MQIEQNSELQGNYNNKYLNSEGFGSQLFFSDPDISKLYFILVRNEDGVEKVISNGVLTGFYENSKYKYRFDFKNYIWIHNQNIENLTTITTNVKSFTVNNRCKLSLFLSHIDNLLSLSHVTKINESEYIINNMGGMQNYFTTFQYTFYDKKDGELFNYNDGDVVRDSIISVTLYNESICYYTITYEDLSSETGSITAGANETKVGLIHIPSSCFFLDLELTDNGFKDIYISEEPINCRNRYYDYFYFGINGFFNRIRCLGEYNDTVLTTKNYINVSNKKYLNKISTEKKIKQNTGFKLNQDEIYSLIQSPKIYKIDNSLNIKKYNIDNNTFEGYRGLLLSEKNLEIIMSEEKTTERKTNLKVGFYD